MNRKGNKRGKCSVLATNPAEREPDFIRKLKQEIGYKDNSDTIETKRQRIQRNSDSESDDEADGEEQPQVVVLKSGDLTSDQAKIEKTRLEKEEAEKPADLTQKIIFNKKKTTSNNADLADLPDLPAKKKSKKKATAEIKSKLSFELEEDNEEDGT